MKTKTRFLVLLTTLISIFSLIFTGCSAILKIETPIGDLKVESLSYYTGHLTLRLSHADKKVFTVEDLQYLVQSEAYLFD